MTRQLRSLSLHTDSSGSSIRILYENYGANGEKLGSDAFWVTPESDLSIHDQKIQEICLKCWEMYS